MAAQNKPDLDVEQSRGTFEKVTRGVGRLSRVIDALLEFARAGGPTPGAHANLREVLDEVVSELTPAAQDAQTRIEIEPFAPLQLACTGGALRSVLGNLLGNAVKYSVESHQSERRITVRVKPSDDKVHVEVEDNGPGLPAGADAEAFEPFRRFTSSRPGIGIGLATVKKLVEGYHGEVGVSSKSGVGSRFWFVLPRAPEADG